MSEINIPCTATRGATIPNPSSENPSPPFDISMTKNERTNDVNITFNVYISDGFTGTPNLTADIATKSVYLNYTYSEYLPAQVAVWSIAATVANSNTINLGDVFTFYNRDLDPKTSRGIQVTVKPPH